jgi:nucleotide-binding universal stress UspA family protein
MSSAIRRVLVGVSGSAGSLQALRLAVNQARAFDAFLVPIIAWEPPGGDAALRRYPAYLTDAWAEDATGRLLTAFDEGLGGPPAEVSARPMVVRGRPGRVLVALADEDGDLLVVGAGRQGRIRRAWYGSVSRYCLTHARCPVATAAPSRLSVELDRFVPGLGRPEFGLPGLGRPGLGSPELGVPEFGPHREAGTRPAPGKSDG